MFDISNVSPEMICKYFSIFSRFEYALKRSGFITGNEKKVSADWDTFAAALACLDENAFAPILECSKYLRANPPRKQVLQDGELRWVFRPSSKSLIRDILLDVRTVRNNVFHGGKFPENSGGAVSDPLRDQKLIGECTSIVLALLELPEHQKIKNFFYEE